MLPDKMLTLCKAMSLCCCCSCCFLYLSREEKQIWPTESLQSNIQSCQERSSKQSRHIVTEQSPFSLTSAPQTGHQSIIIKITTIIGQSLHAILRHRLTSCLHKSMYYMSPDPLLALALGTGRLRQTTPALRLGTSVPRQKIVAHST